MRCCPPTAVLQFAAAAIMVGIAACTGVPSAEERARLGAQLEQLARAPARTPSNRGEAWEPFSRPYRARGATNPPPATLPDSRLLEFAREKSPRQRAAFCELARSIKDPALVGTLAGLAKNDPDFEVRRAA